MKKKKRVRRKQKRHLGKIGVAAIVVGVLVFALFSYFTSTAKAENSIGIDVQREYGGQLAVIENGQQILKIRVSAYLAISYAGIINSSSINGKIQVYIDSILKQEIYFNNPQILISGQKYALASLNLTDAQIQAWASQFGQHTLRFVVPKGATLTVMFKDGKQETKTYDEASAIMYLNVESDSGITVADITFETGSEIKPIEVFSDAACTIRVTQIDWGALIPSSSSRMLVHIKNGFDVPSTITFTTSDWLPSNAEEYLTLTWNLTDTFFSAKETKPVEFTLHVDSSISDITNLSFNIDLTGVS